MATPTARPSPLNLKVIGRALRHRNYRLFFFGQGVSLIGTWLQQLAMPWLVYRLTDSPSLLGLAAFMGQIPVLVLGPVAGVIGDRFPRRRLVLITQTIAMVLAFVLAWLTLSGHIQVWHIFVLAILGGTTAAFDMPVRQAMMFELIDDKQDIANAIALNSSQVNMARIVGPAIGGIMIGLIGEGGCFLINAISFGAVIVSLLMLQLHNHADGRKRRHPLTELREGFSYVAGFLPIRAIILLLGLNSVVGMMFTVLLPVFAKDVLHGDETTYAVLMGSGGVGAFIGAIALAARPSVRGLIGRLPRACALMSLCAIAFAFSPWTWLSALLRLIASIGFVIVLAASNSILQTIVPDDRRARVMGFYIMAFIGMTPFGSILGGFLGDHIGPHWTLVIAGVTGLVGAAFFASRLPAIRTQVRPIYVDLGIIPAGTVPGPMTPAGTEA